MLYLPNRPQHLRRERPPALHGDMAPSGTTNGHDELSHCLRDVIVELVRPTLRIVKAGLLMQHSGRVIAGFWLAPRGHGGQLRHASERELLGQ